MTDEDYLGRVALGLRDLPWRTRRELSAELREHLAELPDGTDLAARLGTPEAYADDLREAAGLGRRHGPIAFIRARRPRNVVMTFLALTALGLATGAFAWIQTYQPLATGNTALDPLDAVASPAGDGLYVVFHQGKPFRYGMTIRNKGRFSVRVLGLQHMPGLPVSTRLLMSPATEWKYGGIPHPYTPFHPFDLAPGQQRGLVFSGVYHEPCRNRAPAGSVDWYSIPVRFGFLWRTTTVQIRLPETLAFVFRKGSRCR